MHLRTAFLHVIQINVWPCQQIFLRETQIHLAQVVIEQVPQFRGLRGSGRWHNAWGRLVVMPPGVFGTAASWEHGKAYAPAQQFPSAVALGKGWQLLQGLVLHEKQEPEFNVISPTCKALTNKIAKWEKIWSDYSQKRKPKRIMNFWEGEFIFLGNQEKGHFNNNGHLVPSDLRLVKESRKENSHSLLLTV